MAIYLIRHGQTDFNASRVVQYPHTPLSARGREQARRVGERLKTAPIDLVLSSDYTRAQQTAEDVAAGTGAPLELTASLRERNFGDLRGTAYVDLPENAFGDDYHPVNGESWPQFHARVDQAWAEVLQVASRVERALVVVTHGLVLNSLLDRVLSQPQDSTHDESVVSNTSVTIVERRPPFCVRLMGCTKHLSGMD